MFLQAYQPDNVPANVKILALQSTTKLWLALAHLDPLLHLKAAYDILLSDQAATPDILTLVS